jgi:hypothetical protein
MRKNIYLQVSFDANSERLKDGTKTSKTPFIDTPPFKPHNEVSQNNLFGNIEFGGVVFDTKPLNLTSPLYIDMKVLPPCKILCQKFQPTHLDAYI